jgi:biopolymer transport protein ExbD
MKRARRDSRTIQPNLTPMVDVVFLLIVFFIVVAQITTSERFELILPKLLHAQTTPQSDERRVVINVVPEAEMEAQQGAFLLAGSAFGHTEEAYEELVRRLSKIRGRDPSIAVSVRADRSEQYERVHVALRACQDAGITRVNLIAERVERAP